MTANHRAHGLFVSLALALAACSGHDSDPGICAEQTAGATAEGEKVTVCQKIHRETPFVRLPGDDKSATVQTVHGVIELDIRGDPEDPSIFRITEARLVDRNLKVYVLVNRDGTPVNETSPLMTSNHLPSNRVHFLTFEAKGSPSADKFQLDSLRPEVMLTGRAIDERFLGMWEGGMSLYDGDREWSVDQMAKVRVEMAALAPHEDIPQIIATITPPLPDGTRFKALGGVVNAVSKVKLSTGECIASLKSLNERNPLFEASDSLLTLWRFPAMHTADSRDFHIVLDYPRRLYEAAIAMAEQHNFRLHDYISPATAPMELQFKIHGNPIRQIVITLKPVKGGGEAC